MDLQDSTRCLNGISTHLELSLRLLLEFVVQQNSLVKNNGSTEDTRVETDSTTNDANDVNIGVESSGVVYDTARPDKSTSGTSECSHGGHDRCICGMDESRG